MRPAFLLPLLLVATPAQGASDRAPLTIFYTSNTLGETKACGCGEGMLGGLARRTTVIARERADHAPVLLLDAGNTFFISPEIPKHLAKEALQKASRIADVYRQLRYDAVLAGENDAPLPEEAKKGIPFLAGDGSALLVERDGWRVAVFGYRSSFLTPEGRAKTDSARQKLAVDLKTKLQQAILKKEKEADLTVLLIAAPEQERDEVVKSLSGIDLAICGYTGQLLWEPVQQGDTLLFEAGERGQYLGRIQVQRASEASGKKEPLSALNQAPRLKMAKELKFVEQELRRYREAPTEKPGIEDKDPAEELEIVEHREADLDAKLASLHAMPQNWYAHNLVPLSESIPDDDAVAKILK
ncbi:MAG: hypothetical protein V1798_04955 [Pseudomonadota bacterium]